MLSAMRFNKAFKDLSFLVSIWELNKGEDSRNASNQVPPQVQAVLEKFKDVIPSRLLKKLSLRHKMDHEIELEQGAKLRTLVPYRMVPPKLNELRKQLINLLDVGYIHPLKAPFGAPVLFQKKDHSLRMCIDYRTLKKITIKKKYLIPLIADLFNWLGKAQYFTKLDLHFEYY